MTPKTFIFFGRSGSGKGTQAELLMKYLKEVDPERKVVYVETGQRFRDFLAKSSTYTSKLIKDVMHTGGLLPAFLPIWIWTGLLIDELTGDDHVVFDGISRRVIETPIVDSAISFYNMKEAYLVFLDTHPTEATDRLLKRGRHDDKHEEIKKRMDWFETDVMPAVNNFKNNPLYTFLTIDGNQTVQKVHEDIKKATGLL